MWGGRHSRQVLRQDSAWPREEGKEAPEAGAKGGGVGAGSDVRWGREVSGGQKTLWAGEGPGLCPGSREPQKCLSRAVTYVRCMFHTVLWMPCGVQERAADSSRGVGRQVRGSCCCPGER